MVIEASDRMSAAMFDNIDRYADRDIDSLLAEELGPRYTAYRKRWDSVNINNIPSFPIHIDFEPNDRCNQSCVMCPRNRKKHAHVSYRLNTNTALHFEDYRIIIDEGAEKGLESINLGAFGEPLLHRDIFAMVAYAHEKGIVDSRLITNGLLLNKYTDQIFDSGLVNLFVSIDAFSQETYTAIRGKGFGLVRGNILDFIEAKRSRSRILPIVRVSFVEMEINAEEKNEFISFWSKKADIVDIQKFDNFDADITRRHDKEKKKKWECRSPWSRVSVLSNGSVLPCCNFYGCNIPIGNIHGNSIEEIWNSAKMKAVREGVLADSIPNCSICQRAA